MPKPSSAEEAILRENTSLKDCKFQTECHSLRLFQELNPLGNAAGIVIWGRATHKNGETPRGKKYILGKKTH